MNANKLTATMLLLSSTWSLPVAGQPSGDRVAAVKTNDGYIVVWNQPGIHFTLELKGKNVSPINSAPAGTIAFNIDGVVLQVQSAAISDFAKNAKKQKLSDQAILEAHRDWESQYQQQAVGTKLNVSSSPQQLSSGSQALLWKFDMPKPKSGEQMYLTTVSGSQVIILNAFVPRKPAESGVQRLLLDTMSTVKPSQRPIDLLKVQQSVRGNSL